MKKTVLYALLAYLIWGCSSESLQLQTEFPFTVESEPVPSTVKAGRSVPFQLKITPERLSSQTQYALRYRPLSDSTASLTLDGQELIPETYHSLKSLTPLIRFQARGASSYQFSLVVIDQAGVSQTVPISVQVN